MTSKIDWTKIEWRVEGIDVILVVDGCCKGSLDLITGSIGAPTWNLPQRKFVYEQARAVWVWLDGHIEHGRPE